MNTNPSLGTGFAGVLAHAVAAGIMASSSGSARVAPAPFRNVRLGIALFVINITLSFYIASGPPAPHALTYLHATDDSSIRAVLIWNGTLLTIPRIRPENLYPSFSASRTILRTAGAS